MPIGTKTLPLIGAVFGGFIAIKFGFVIGPVNFNNGFQNLTEFDEQKARALRIKAENQAAEAAKRLRSFDLKVLEQLHIRAFETETGVKTHFGQVYMIFCEGKPRLGGIAPLLSDYEENEGLNACRERVFKNKCPNPHSRTFGGTNTWNLQVLQNGWLYFC